MQSTRFPSGPVAEWPTLVLLAAVHGGLALLTWQGGNLPAVAVVPALAILVALHSSLQHEVIHGHPFRSRFWSDATVFLPVGLFVPYERFRDTHLRHHFDPNLTDPYDDPETAYEDEVAHARAPRAWRALLALNATLAGRVVLGPAIGLAKFYAEEWRLLRADAPGVRRGWTLHALGLGALALWAGTVATVPAWVYLAGAYGGMSLLKIRTFAEHRAHERAAGRSVIIEDRGPLAFLFLNNNYHALHHAHPGLPWYALPAVYRARRELILRRNGGYRFRSYGELFARHLFVARDRVTHPFWSLRNRTAPLPASRRRHG